MSTGFGGLNYGSSAWCGTSITNALFNDVNGIITAPQRISTLVQATRRLYPTINAGVSGDTSLGGLARFESQVLAYGPSMVSLEFGTNDPTVATPVPVGAVGTAGSYMDNMAQMIVKAQRTGARVTIWVPILAQDATRNSQVAPYRTAARSLASTYGCDLFDTAVDMAALATATQNSYFHEPAGSGLHLSAAGNAWAAGLVGSGAYANSFVSAVKP